MAAGRGGYGPAARWGMLRSLGLALRAAMRPGGPSIADRLAAVPRMARAALRGDFPGVSKGRLLGMLAALLYVVSPVDLVPEGLFSVFGLADDAMLVGWLATALINDTETFLQWERAVGARTAGPQDAPPPSGSAGWQAQTVQSHTVPPQSAQSARSHATR